MVYARAMFRFYFPVGVALLLSCGGSALTDLASRGDYAALSKELATRTKAGNLHNGEAARAAERVLVHELSHASRETALQYLHMIRPCSRELDDYLEERMEKKDDVGAMAALLRVEHGGIGTGAARSHLESKEDAWRAVGTRGLVDDDDGPRRLAAMGDGSPWVRRQAMVAAREAKDPRDRERLLECARLDPDPLLRSEAVRTLTTLPGDTKTTLALHDVWMSADEPLRGEIAVAWASKNLLQAGGKDALQTLFGQGRGIPLLSGAAAVLRAPDEEGTAPLKGAAAEAVLRSLRTGGGVEQLFAVSIAPVAAREGIAVELVTDVRTLLRKYGEDRSNQELRVAALSRLLELPSDRKNATEQLEALARNKDAHVHASRAKFLLASTGHMRIQSWIEEDLSSKDTQDKISALLALSAMGRASRGAKLLADSDPLVRVEAGCALVAAGRRKDDDPLLRR